ncbi:SnoaL-like domain-containing protein [Frankia sp. EI5c]|uniref:nuclear transport factor 2 family protein n=1 Tax=Frankia sp. EI5c TaxID=683316 RepID=UPI0007C3B3D2|nr:nuclear transport factor 2 family protein [Frankia sp. EI5c]OAA23901.1 SnoaL-like domain-containing protein [Frankia sp. EI5c]
MTVESPPAGPTGAGSPSARAQPGQAQPAQAPSTEDRLRELLDKQDIREAVLRYARGIERLDAETLASAFHDDVIYEHHIGTPSPPYSNARELAELIVELARKSPLTAKFLAVPSTLIELAGNVAYVESHALALNVFATPEGEVTHWRGIRWLDRFERRDSWKIAHRVILHSGFERYEPAAPSPASASFHPDSQSRNHPDDLVYHLRERLTPGAVWT